MKSVSLQEAAERTGYSYFKLRRLCALNPTRCRQTVPGARIELQPAWVDELERGCWSGLKKKRAGYPTVPDTHTDSFRPAPATTTLAETHTEHARPAPATVTDDELLQALTRRVKTTLRRQDGDASLKLAGALEAVALRIRGKVWGRVVPLPEDPDQAEEEGSTDRHD